MYEKQTISLLLFRVRRIMRNQENMTPAQEISAPNKEGHSLSPGTCESFTFHGKRDFADMIKAKDLEVGRLF